ncbi:hypothetical protein FBQ96_08205 [Nitrospirales bacterium NOB]|nr:MAG: hypothetical protein UZ03_NOB001003616 [Nitrospira sp. OLB3]MBV6468443.1 hypothetical protein [Nitrospirota bacterium]MCE7963957.1 hypothetical protein [Nitrospira sp. NTP2]MDL1889547.1 hypothetical protein [Nitrospirales bacterium NOB]MEB2340284.1 polysaccharide deacetylase family protein [Nitrospirales bacterium]RIK61419.1 MAG: hypothetical protein DCC63_01390 [Nitrospira sp.]
MICLTGDVHHRSYRGADTRYARESEAQLALRYCDIAARYHIKVTLFVTGQACLEERDTVAELGRRAHCEIGGHTFCAFRSWRHWLSRKLGGSILGPASLQRRDIDRTIAAIEETAGIRITAWRNHAYKRDASTYPLLGERGIRIVSDRVSGVEGAMERISQELVSLPINTLPDHEHLLHGKYLPAHTKPHRLAGRKTIQEWRKTVMQQVEAIEEHDGIATILAHPLCMEIADGMKEFKALCRFLARFQTGWVSEALQNYTRVF